MTAPADWRTRGVVPMWMGVAVRFGPPVTEDDSLPDASTRAAWIDVNAMVARLDAEWPARRCEMGVMDHRERAEAKTGGEG